MSTYEPMTLRRLDIILDVLPKNAEIDLKLSNYEINDLMHDLSGKIQWYHLNFDKLEKTDKPILIGKYNNLSIYQR